MHNDTLHVGRGVSTLCYVYRTYAYAEAYIRSLSVVSESVYVPHPDDIIRDDMKTDSLLDTDDPDYSSYYGLPLSYHEYPMYPKKYNRLCIPTEYEDPYFNYPETCSKEETCEDPIPLWFANDEY